jgi:hypothetical protein
MLDRGDKDAITLLFAAVLNKGSMKVEQKRKEIKKAGLSGISIGSVQLTASTKTDRDLREDRDERKSGRQGTADTTYR